MAGIQRAILSCHDKTNLVEFAEGLREFGVELISTAGTLRTLEKAGIEAQSLSDYTGVREMMEGRVKSLHPKVHAGLLGIRENKIHEEEMEAQGYGWIDMVVANLRPLSAVASNPNASLEEVMSQVDIGGAAMIRSAAKNFQYVTVVVNPERYSSILHNMRAHDGQVSFAARHRLAREAFRCTAEYDRALADYLQSKEPPKE